MRSGGTVNPMDLEKEQSRECSDRLRERAKTCMLEMFNVKPISDFLFRKTRRASKVRSHCTAKYPSPAY